jgi:hypothetical protein
MHRILLPIVIFGCTPPPAAPETFDELTSYLIIHFDDEDPVALQAGMNNMRAWLDENQSEVEEGYRLDDLTSNAVDAIPDPCSVDAPLGAGASFEIAYPIEEVMEVALAHDPLEVYEGSFNYNDRVFVEDLECFLDRTCERTEYHSHIENNLPLGITMEVWYVAQVRWVELDDGPAILYRTWMSEPAVSNLSWIDVNQQYGVATNFSSDVGTRKLEAGWIDMALGDIELPEDFALNMVVDSIVESGAKLEAYMDAEL